MAKIWFQFQLSFRPLIPRTQRSSTLAPHENPLLEDPQFSFNSNAFPLGIPSQSQEFLDTNTLMTDSNSNDSSSAPTAPGRLLRSSMFKELVEKNLNAGNKQENDTKELLKAEGNEFRGMFFNGICPSKVESLGGMELDEEKNELALFSNPNQSLWNGSLNMNKSCSRN